MAAEMVTLNGPKWCRQRDMPLGLTPPRAPNRLLMRLRELRSALHDHCVEAAGQLAADTHDGHEVPFEVVDEGRRDAPLYCYRPLTAEFINQRTSVLTRGEAVVYPRGGLWLFCSTLKNLRSPSMARNPLLMCQIGVFPTTAAKARTTPEVVTMTDGMRMDL